MALPEGIESDRRLEEVRQSVKSLQDISDKLGVTSFRSLELKTISSSSWIASARTETRQAIGSVKRSFREWAVLGFFCTLPARLITTS